MALARVVSFDGVSQERVEEMKGRMNEGRPDDIPATEIVMLHDAGTEKAIVVLFFDNEDDYNRADATLSAMPPTRRPGSAPRLAGTRSRCAQPPDASSRAELRAGTFHGVNPSLCKGKLMVEQIQPAECDRRLRCVLDPETCGGARGRLPAGGSAGGEAAPFRHWAKSKQRSPSSRHSRIRGSPVCQWKRSIPHVYRAPCDRPLLDARSGDEAPDQSEVRPTWTRFRALPLQSDGTSRARDSRQLPGE